MLTYDRYMRDFRAKRLAAQLEREMPRDDREVVPAVHVALLAARRAVKDSVRGMEGFS